MGRRRESGFELLMSLPPWLSIVVGVLGYFGITLVVPAILSTSKMLAGVGPGLRPVAMLWLGLCLIAAAFSAIRAALISRKFDSQRGLSDIRSLSWQQFETIVGEAFRRRGYSVMENGGGGADGGIDLVLRKDGEKFYVQCKQWKVRTVGVKPIRELFGVISARGASGGFFVNSGTYTSEAREFAKESGIELIDGPALEQMVREAQEPEPYLDPTIRSRRFTTTWTDGSAAPSCPTCGSAMVGRKAKRGANAGSEFWGCSRYPQCRGTRPV